MGAQNKPTFEKRRFPRLETKCLISYEYFDDEFTEDVEGMGLSQNLSLGGVLIEIDKQVRVGATLFLELALLENMIKATGKIVHLKPIQSDKYDVGISFTEIKPEDLKVLALYFREKGIKIDIDFQ